MKHHLRTIACGTALLITMTMTLVACGGRQTMASKSAAAYDEARKKGVPIGAGEHSGHSAEAATEQPTTTGTDHSAMPGMDHSPMSPAAHKQMGGMDHSTMPAMDHATMPGMDHSKMSTSEHAPMSSEEAAGWKPADRQAGKPALPVVIAPPATNSAIAQIQPAATLRADELDAPAPAALDEAAKTTAQPPSSEHHHHDDGEAS